MQPSLPVEIYGLVVSQLSSPHHKRDLYTLATTSNVFFEAAIRELYRSVESTDSRTTKLLFERVISGSKDGTDIGMLINELKLELDLGESPEILNLAREALPLLQNLVSLDYSSNSPSPSLANICELAHFKLTYLFIKTRFFHDQEFETFLSRQSCTLRVLELLDPTTSDEEEELPEGHLPAFPALDAVAAPGYYLARILTYSQPTKLADLDSGLRFFGLPAGDRRKITLFMGDLHSRANEFTLNTFGAHLRFLRLYVEINYEVLASSCQFTTTYRIQGHTIILTPLSPSGPSCT